MKLPLVPRLKDGTFFVQRLTNYITVCNNESPTVTISGSQCSPKKERDTLEGSTGSNESLR